LVRSPTSRTVMSGTISSFLDIKVAGINVVEVVDIARNFRSPSIRPRRNRSPTMLSSDFNDIVPEDRVSTDNLTTRPDHRPNDSQAISEINAATKQFFSTVSQEDAARLLASRPTAATLWRVDRRATPTQPRQSASELDTQEEVIITDLTRTEERSVSVPDIPRERVISTLAPSSASRRSQISQAALLHEHDSNTSESDFETSDSGIRVTGTSMSPPRRRLRSESRRTQIPEYHPSPVESDFRKKIIGFAGEQWVVFDRLPLTARYLKSFGSAYRILTNIIGPAPSANGQGFPRAKRDELISSMMTEQGSWPRFWGWTP
jgi:hypothetical protein